MKKFLIINPFGIGDVLFTTPLIRALRGCEPDCVIGYWCNQRARDIFAYDPDVQHIFALSRGDLKRVCEDSVFDGAGRLFGTAFGLRRAGFDCAFDCSLDPRYAVVSMLAGVRRRVGYNCKKRGMLTDSIAIDCYRNKHMVEYYLDLLQFVRAVRPENPRLSIFVPDFEKAKAHQALERCGIRETDTLVGIAGGAGASWGKDAGFKRWPAVKFAQLADRIAQQLGCKVILLGDASERPIAESIIAMTKSRPVDFVGKTSLLEFAALLQHINVLVTNDGGPLHMAVACGIKTAAIFGPVDSKVYGPYPSDTARHIVIKRDLPCIPCYDKFRMPLCERDKECVRSIDTQEVFETVKKLLLFSDGQVNENTVGRSCGAA